MSVKVREYRAGGWEADIRVRLANGKIHRERLKSPASGRKGAQRWGEDRERELLRLGVPLRRTEVPSLSEFWPRFTEGYVVGNRLKPSGAAAKATIGRVHLQPRLGSKKLDAITTEDVERLKFSLRHRSPTAAEVRPHEPRSDRLGAYGF
jgi:hypothetical protein